MVSFGKLWENMEKSKSPLMGTGEDSRALSVVRAGKNMRKEDDSSFWDDFISLCNNTDGMAQLFNVSPEKILGFPAKIREALQKLEKEDSESPSAERDTKVMPTGDNGAIEFPKTNSDPYMGTI